MNNKKYYGWEGGGEEKEWLLGKNVDCIKICVKGLEIASLQERFPPPPLSLRGNSP